MNRATTTQESSGLVVTDHTIKERATWMESAPAAAGPVGATPSSRANRPAHHFRGVVNGKV